MPPKTKRAAAGPAAAPASKRTRTSTSSNAPAAAPQDAPAPAAATKKKKKPASTQRWSAVSASKNADQDFKDAVQNPAEANRYICHCPPSYVGANEDSDDDSSSSSEDDSDDDDDDDDEPANNNKCDGGETCPCQKPAEEHPEHEFIMTYGGFRKWFAALSMANLRCPDFFDMYTWNDHEAQGALEVLHNLLLDWDEAETWQEQWVVCEGLVLFALGQGQQFCMIDDGDQANEAARLIGRLFLTMLARLEAAQLLADGTQVRNLGLVMALYMKLAAGLRPAGLLDDDDKAVSRRVTPAYTWVPSRFDDYILAYANKFGITLSGFAGLDELVAGLETDVRLPPDGAAAWGWDAAFKSYAKGAATVPPGRRGARPVFGGDSLDVTTWSSAERKAHSFSNRDPIGKKDLDALKKGMVMQVM